MDGRECRADGGELRTGGWVDKERTGMDGGADWWEILLFKG